MGKAYNNGVNVPTGFNHNHNQPIDSRIVVDTFNDLLVDSESIIPTVYLYKWIKITANDTGIEYKWNGADRTVAGNWEKAVSESWIKGGLGEGTADLAEPGYPNKVESYASAAMGYDIEIGSGLPIYDSYGLLVIGANHRIKGTSYGLVSGSKITTDSGGPYSTILGTLINVHDSYEAFIHGVALDVTGYGHFVAGTGVTVNGQTGPVDTKTYIKGTANFVNMTRTEADGDKVIDGHSNFVSGTDHEITHSNAYFNAILSGRNHLIETNITDSAIIGGNGITATKSNTLYCPKLNIGSIDAYADDAAAGAAGLVTGDTFQTNGTGAAPLNVPGIVMVKQ